MPFDGQGGYSAPVNSWNPAVSQTVIDPTDWNSTQADYETALSNVICKDGQTNPTANLPMAGFKHTGVNTNSASTSRSEYASGATFQDGAPLDAGDTAGTSTAYTATLTPAITAYADKQCFRVKFDQACGADPTINFNSVGAKKIYKNVSGTATQLSANDVPQNYIGILRYDTALDAAAGGFWLTNVPIDAGGTVRNALTLSSSQIRLAKGADVASANALTLGDDGNYFDITGTTAITSIGTKGVGTVVRLHFDDALTLTHHATDLILPGGANITTAAGDEAEFVEYATGDWRCTSYTKASGAPVTDSSAFVRVSTTTASNSATIDLALSGGYSDYEVHIIDLVPATDNVELWLRVSEDGSTYKAGASDYSYALDMNADNATAPNDIASTGDSEMMLSASSGDTRTLGNASGESYSGVIRIYGPSGTSRNKKFAVHATYDAQTGNYAAVIGGGRYKGTTNAITNIRFLTSSGNITSGTFVLYGVRTS